MTDKFEKDFLEEGYDVNSFWKLNEEDRKYILKKWTDIYRIEVSKRRFNEQVYRMVCQRKKKNFFEWLKNSRFEKN